MKNIVVTVLVALSTLVGTTTQSLADQSTAVSMEEHARTNVRRVSTLYKVDGIDPTISNLRKVLRTKLTPEAIKMNFQLVDIVDMKVQSHCADKSKKTKQATRQSCVVWTLRFEQFHYSPSSYPFKKFTVDITTTDAPSSGNQPPYGKSIANSSDVTAREVIHRFFSRSDYQKYLQDLNYFDENRPAHNIDNPVGVRVLWTAHWPNAAFKDRLIGFISKVIDPNKQDQLFHTFEMYEGTDANTLPIGPKG